MSTAQQLLSSAPEGDGHERQELAAALVEALPGSRIIKRELKTDNCRKNGIYVQTAKGEVWHSLAPGSDSCSCPASAATLRAAFRTR